MLLRLENCRLSYKYRKRTKTITAGVEEAYLRDDVPCGSEACCMCTAPAGASLSATAPYFLLPDAQVLGELLEVFELPDISNCIFLTSVVKQVLHSAAQQLSVPRLCATLNCLFQTGMIRRCLALLRHVQFNLQQSLRKLSRLRALYRDKRRRSVLFDDLHCLETATCGCAETAHCMAQMWLIILHAPPVEALMPWPCGMPLSNLLKLVQA